MDPAALIPTPDAIPVAWGWLQFFLLLTFFLHIVLMNATLGTAFIALVTHLRGRNSSPCAPAVAANLPYVVAFTVNFGVAPLLFVQALYGQFFYVSSILTAVFWLSIIALLISAYALAYVYKHQYNRLGKRRSAVVGPIILLLLTIAFCFAGNISLMQDPAAWSRYFDQPRGMLLNLADPMLLPRYLHFMVASMAVGGLAMALFFDRKRRQGDASAAPLVRQGCRWFARATLLNGAVGLWFLAALPRGVLTVATTDGLLLAASLAGGVLLAVPAVVFGLAGRVAAATWCGLGAIALMVLARSLLRAALLAPWFSLSQLEVRGSVWPMILFLSFLAAGVALIVWMIRFALRSSAEKEVRQ